jgi:telomere length regulation protein
VTSAQSRAEATPKSAEEALHILRNEPDYDSLVETLRLLRRGKFEQESFHITKPSPTGAQIVHVLVADIAPNYWTLFQEDALDNLENRKKTSNLQLFLDCLRSLPGVNAVLLRLRALTQEAKSEKKDVKRPDLVSNLRITLALLEEILQGADCIRRIWASSNVEAQGPSQRRLLAQECLALLGGGRIVSYAAEADAILNLVTDKKRSEGTSRILDGAEYSSWLGQNVVEWISQDISADDSKLCSDLLARALRLGYAGKSPWPESF